MGGTADWESEAENWVRWARTPGHDPYWFYRSSFFDLLPSTGGRVIEVGCGEGRVTRDLAARGFQVVGSDNSATLVRYARQEDPTGSYVLADAAALPAATRSFDLVVAYNSLQVVGDMPETVREASRVLRRGGSFCACVSHPFSDLGHFLDDDSGPIFAIRPSYFSSQWVEDTVEKDGLPMSFTGWTYTLEDYVDAFERAGLVIQTVREPIPEDSSDRFARWRQIPMFLMIRSSKP